MTYAMIDTYCASYQRPPRAVTLDIDDTLDVVHGHQQLSLFNAHYDERCFLPIHVYDTATARPVAVLLRTGTTTVADIEAVPDLLPAMWQTTPLRVISFLELIGITHRRSPLALLKEALDKASQLKHRRCRIGLSPHAPYSTLPGLLRLSAETARGRGWRLCSHVAESEQEFEMFMQARGEMFHWLQRNDRDMSDCGLGSPVQHLARNRMLGENLLAVHVNLLADGDVSLLGAHHTHVVHCPRSHSYFRHPPFQRQQLADAGVNLCLGTDSLATVRPAGKPKPELDMFEEMRALADCEPELSPRDILRLATVNGARALGLGGQIGELVENGLADLITIPARAKAGDAAETVLAHAGAVSSVMIDGQWVISPDGV
jgi:cytosine/adenosine deaminase-related metal-dependent hydrolase